MFKSLQLITTKKTIVTTENWIKKNWILEKTNTDLQ